MYDNLAPRERLAKIVAEETGDGRRIVRFLVQVAEGQLHSEGFKPCHRMDSAKELVKIGLTEFSDYIHANSTPLKPTAGRTSRPDSDISPEIAEARERLAQYARELTQDGRTVIRMYAEVMEGARNDEGFKPHHRIAAARELIKRGFDYECDHDQAADAGPVTSETRPEPTTNDSELTQEYLESEENMAIVIEKLKRIVEQTPPEEREAHEEAMRNVDLSMWDDIAAQPPPVITREHIRIGAAKFDETLERWRAWDESGVKIPDPPEELSQYDDG